MNCANHQEVPAIAYCRDCGKPMCSECQRPALGSIYCAEHVPVTAPVINSTAPELPPPPPPRDYRTFAEGAPPPPPPPPASDSPYSSPYAAQEPAKQCHVNTHPVLALFLGFIPGVGAIYNGQYAKGLIHALVFGMLITIITNSRGGMMIPLVSILLAAWVFYMAIEAFHTASKRRKGLEVEEFSSLIDVQPKQGRFPVGALLLIAIGFILLLDTTDIINIEQLTRYWPMGLIVVGVYMLYNRVSSSRPNDTESGAKAEARR
jgi:TM2 domain-containing membrane protein YozV